MADNALIRLDAVEQATAIEKIAQAQTALARILKADSVEIPGINVEVLTLNAQNIKVVDQESNQTCVNLMNDFGTGEKRVLEFFEGLAEDSNGLHKAITTARNRLSKPYTKGKTICKEKSEAYQLQVLKATKQAEEKAAEDQKRRQAEAAREAERLLEQGFVKQAKAKLLEVEVLSAPVSFGGPQKAAGSRVGIGVEAKVTDIAALCRAIGAGEIPLMWDVRGNQRPLVVVDQVVLNAIVDRQGKGTNIPGVTVEDAVSVGSAKLG